MQGLRSKSSRPGTGMRGSAGHQQQQTVTQRQPKQPQMQAPQIQPPQMTSIIQEDDSGVVENVPPKRRGPGKHEGDCHCNQAAIGNQTSQAVPTVVESVARDRELPVVNDSADVGALPTVSLIPDANELANLHSVGHKCGCKNQSGRASMVFRDMAATGSTLV